MDAFKIEVFFDGQCPLCMREIAMLRRRDKAQAIRFTDISAAGFDASAVGLTQATLMGRIHGRLPDGSMLEGVDVFRQLYAAVGFGRLVTASRWPGVRQMLDAGYSVFAKNRLKWTGRDCEGGCRVT